MAVTRVKGKAPAKPAAKSAPEAETAVGTVLGIMGATAKLTISIKRRLGNGDEVFIAPGIEINCAADELDTKQAEVAARVHSWMDDLLAKYPDPTDEADDATDDADADDADEADEDEADEDEDGLTEEDIAGMDKKELLALLKDQEVEIEGAAKMTIKALRAAAIEELFAEDGDEDGDGDGDEDESEEDESDGDGEEDSGGYTEDELKKLKLEELQEVCTEWDIGDPKMKKGIDVKAKKLAYIKHILASQAEDE